VFLLITQSCSFHKAKPDRPIGGRQEKEENPGDGFEVELKCFNKSQENLQCEVEWIRDNAGIRGCKGIKWVSRRMIDTLGRSIRLVLLRFLEWKGSCQGVKGDFRDMRRNLG
jgi:hypothetical protein